MNLVEEKKNIYYNVDKQKNVKLPRKKKNLIDKIHKQIIKELKINVNCHIKKMKIKNFFKSNNA